MTAKNNAFQFYELLIIGKMRRGRQYVTMLRDENGGRYEVLGANFHRKTGDEGMVRFEAKVCELVPTVQLNYARKIRFIEAPSNDPEELRQYERLSAMFQLVVDAGVRDELIAQGFVMAAQVESEVYADRQIYVFLKSDELQQTLSQYGTDTYYAT